MVTIRTKANPALPDKSTVKLLALLRHSRDSVAAEIASEFQALHRLVESLPLTSAEFCFARNWLITAQGLWEAGDTNAAHYQLTMVARKLKL
jgi:hypothetical protein